VFNRNFSFNYVPFNNGAGEHAVSEAETRAVADFLFAAKNVFAVFTFGPVNNLSESNKYNERDANARIPKGILKDDAVISQMISMRYNQLVSLKMHLKQQQELEISLSGHTFTTEGLVLVHLHGGYPAKSSAVQDRNQEFLPELSFLRWAKEESLEGYFVPWTKIQHPDFPDQEAEVGGIAPFVKLNPPFKMIDQLATEHTEFLIELAQMAPSIDMDPVKIENLGKDLYRILLQWLTKGFCQRIVRLVTG
jgi:hypothetical protein